VRILLADSLFAPGVVASKLDSDGSPNDDGGFPVGGQSVEADTDEPSRAGHRGTQVLMLTLANYRA